MRKARVICYAVGVAAGVALGLFLASRPPEPTYEGRSVTSWVNDFTNGPVYLMIPGVNPVYRYVTFGGAGPDPAGVAMRQFGTNAFPYLLDFLLSRDNALKKKGVLYLRKKLNWRLPNQLAEERQARAMRALYELGTDAAPLLLAVLGDDRASLLTRTEAASRVGMLPGYANRSIPLLLSAMAKISDTNFHEVTMDSVTRLPVPIVMPVLCDQVKGTNVQVQVQAITVIGRLNSRGKDAGPILLKCLQSPHTEVRKAADAALNRVGPDDLPSMLYLVEHGMMKNRLIVCWNLGRKAAMPERVVPALERCLLDPEPSLRESAAEALGKFGPQAVSAVPALQQLLNDPKGYVRTAATNALVKIQNEPTPAQTSETR